MDCKKYMEIVENIKKQISFTPEIAIVLGSGLGSFTDEIDIKHIISYSEIDGFPVSTVEGHKGAFIFGYINNVPVAALQGRVHHYEGYTMEQAVIPIRIMRLIGAKILMLSNAAGGINYSFKPGDLMLISDHISLFVENPLIGKNEDKLGVRFPDMSEVYNKELSEIIRKTALECKIPLKEGIYTQLSGPSYETPAEIRLLRTLGSDAVGMSTVCEAIAAVHCGFKVCGISLITNPAAGVSSAPLCHTEVQKAAKEAEYKFKKLFKKAVINIYDKVL